MTTKLTADKVQEIFVDCMFHDNEVPTSKVVVQGLVHSSIFHLGRLEMHRSDIEELLNELPDQFKKPGGYSFLCAHTDKNGVQWTGFHLLMEQLFLLGLATGKVKCDVPRTLWSILPGGMPYFQVL